MRGLVQSVAHDPEALAGLQTAGRGWIVRKHMNADGTLAGADLIKFLRENRDSLRELFTHNQVAMMGAVARDAEAGARWRTTTAIKGGSNTVKNMLSSLGGKAGEAAKHVSLGIVAVEIASHVFEHGDLGTAAWAGAGAVAAHIGTRSGRPGPSARRTSNWRPWRTRI